MAVIVVEVELDRVRVPQRAQGVGGRAADSEAGAAGPALHAVAVRLVDGAAFAVVHVPGRLVPRFLHGELPVHLPPVGVVHRVDHP